MKKLFVSLLAIAGLVACTNDEVVSVQQGNPIAFDTFVENTTRVGYNSGNLYGFDVWAFMDNVEGVVLTDEDVTGEKGNFSYVNTQYWVPGHTYYFAALAPMNSTNVVKTLATGDAALKGLGTVEFTNVNGTEDLLYAATKIEANDQQGAVTFQFNHLLSKVKFSFTNTFDNGNYSINVRNIQMTAPKTGTIDLTAGEYAWTDLADETTLVYGDALVVGDETADFAAMGKTVSPADERLTIPAGDTQEYIVTFDVDLYVGSTLAKTYNKKSEISGLELEAGKAYNFAADINAVSLNLDKVVFDANVDEWFEVNDAQFEPYTVEVDGTNYDDFAEAVAKAMELNKPVKFFQHVVIDADTTITVPAGEELTLELNGYTLTRVTDDADKNDDGALTSLDNEVMFDVRGEMTVKDGTITTKHLDTNFGWNACTEIFYIGFGGTLNVENTTLENLGGSDMAYAIDMVNATDGITLKVENSTIKSTYIPVRVFNNGGGMNNVEIKNSTLKGGSRAFWVHIYTQADDASFFKNGKDTNGNGYKDETLNINIYNPTCNNTFIANDPNRIIEYGFTNEINFDAYGNQLIADGVGYDETTKTYTVSTAEGLLWIASNVADDADGFAGKTVKLTTDIDLFQGYMSDGDPVSTEPIGSTGEYDDRGRLVCKPFKGTFDGQGHTIKNLYQNGYLWKYWFGQYGSIGLFSELEDATVKNLIIENFEARVEGGDIAFITGSATGDCVFENIEIRNSRIATFNNGIGGIIGWSGAGTYTFKNIKLDAQTTIGGFQQSFDSSVGGIVGQAEPGATYNFENVEISCCLNVFNDVTASWQYYLYRMCGMIIGRCEETTTINGANYPDLSKYNMTFNNVVVNYGDWMNYHYCQGPYGSKGTGARVEPGFLYGGLDINATDHNGTCTEHMQLIPFDQLIGGAQIGVRGLREVNGVTVNYPESFYREQGYKAEGNTYKIYSGQGFKTIATTVLNDGTKNVAIELVNDIDLAGIEWPAVATKAAFVLDGKGYAIKNLTTSAVESNGFYCTALFSSTYKATTIKNLVVENATVTGNGLGNSHGAVLVATNWAALNIEGVTVKNSTVSNCDRSSVIATYLYFTTATVKNCVVEGCTVNSIGTAGALLGINNSHNFEATGNTVKNTTISSSEGSNKAGILIGTWQNAGTLTESNNVVENSKAINAGTETNNNIGRHA